MSGCHKFKGQALKVNWNYSDVLVPTVTVLFIAYVLCYGTIGISLNVFNIVHLHCMSYSILVQHFELNIESHFSCGPF